MSYSLNIGPLAATRREDEGKSAISSTGDEVGITREGAVESERMSERWIEES
jgi:hypothetical protein